MATREAPLDHVSPDMSLYSVETERQIADTVAAGTTSCAAFATIPQLNITVRPVDSQSGSLCGVMNVEVEGGAPPYY